MTIHEFGTENKDTVVLVHPSIVMWDYFERVIPLLEKRFHLVVPALPGYDPEQPGDFTSVEQIAGELADWLIAQDCGEAACVYGCSMGGAVVARLLAEHRIKVRSAVMDGGITPYQLPWIATRFIAIRDFCVISLGKLGGLKLLEKAFATGEYSQQDLKYVAKVLKMMSAKTIWRTFESCNNYTMPHPVQAQCPRIEYWYAKAEAKERKWDMAYIKKNFPGTAFREFENVGHGGLALMQPEKLAAGIEALCQE